MSFTPEPAASEPNHAPVRVLLVDDHGVVRDGLRYVIDQEEGWEVCGEAGTGVEAVNAARELRPDVVILDVTLPELSGVEVLRQIKKESPRTEVIIFTAHQMEDLVHTVFDAGARSYLLKTDSREHLIAAIRAACVHKPYFTPRISEIVFSRYVTRPGAGDRPLPGSSLTAREREVVQLVAEGKSNKEVAARLGTSVRTAESHRAAVMKKLNLQSVGDLIRYAIRNKIVSE